MVRPILAVILGYIAMAIVIMATFTTLQLTLGTENIFQPGSYEVTTTFIAFAVILSFIAAALGGLIAAVIARSHRPIVVLSGIVLALGFVSAGLQLTRPDPGERMPDTCPFEAAGNARQPVWYALGIPFVGAAGVLAGARIRNTRTRPTRSQRTTTDHQS